MALYKRDDVEKVYKAVTNGRVFSVYLVLGDRFLCRQVAEKLLGLLIPDPHLLRQNLRLIDGENEAPLSTLNLLKTYSLFSGRQIVKVTDTRLFLSKEVAKPLWEKAVKAMKSGKLKTAGRYLGKFVHVGRLSLDSVDELIEMPAAKWKSTFGFVKPGGNIAWVEEAFAAADSGNNLQGEFGGEDAAEVYMQAFEAGVPDDNVLVLLAEEVDRRKRFFKFIKDHGVVLDLSVEKGSSKGAKKDQEKVLRTLVAKTLQEFGKKIEPNALPVLFERVGFSPDAVVRETEKLALYADDRSYVTLQDVNELVGRTREDALFELTESYADRHLVRCLRISSRMLESGVHPLVLVSGLRNHIRKLLFICSFRKQTYPVFVDGMTYAAFQKGYLVQLKEAKQDMLKGLPSHPYALFMMFEKGKKHSVDNLVRALKKLLQAELRLKSSSLSGHLIIENFFFDTLVGSGRRAAKP